MNLFIESCFVCDGGWGTCCCQDSITELFVWQGVSIVDCTVSSCGRFYVNPVAYYGDAYIQWAKANPTHKQASIGVLHE